MHLRNSLDIQLLEKPTLEAVDTYAAYALAALMKDDQEEAKSLMISIRQRIQMDSQY
jgi:hypothetical protein